MTIQLAVRVDESVIQEIDLAVERGEFTSRTAAVREALAVLARQLQEREIAQEYALGYGEHPVDDWIGNLGMDLLSAAARGEPEL